MPMNIRQHACVALFAATLAASPSLAALPPQHQRAAELEAAIDAATEVLDGSPVISIEYVLEDVYRVYSEDCTVTVLIETVESEKSVPMPGPRQFRAVADDPVCGPDEGHR